jgi:hypothetical protein
MGFTLANKMLSQSGRVLNRPTNQQDAENVGRRARGPIMAFYFSTLDWGKAFLQIQLGAASGSAELVKRPATPATSHRRWRQIGGRYSHSGKWDLAEHVLAQRAMRSNA